MALLDRSVPTPRPLAAVAGLVLVATASGVAISAPASADPPPAAAGNTSHGFLVDRGRVTTIDHPNATTVPGGPDEQAGTATTGINDRGDVLGAYLDRSDGAVRSFVRDRKGRYTELEYPPGGSELDEYVDINNRGEIVGFYNDDQGATTTGFLRARNGVFKSLKVPGSSVTGPLKVNDRRQVVGIYVDRAGSVHGFLWERGRFTRIDVRGATATVVIGINNRGQTVGSFVDDDGAYHGFLRSRRGTVTTLPEAPGADPMSGGTQPASINDHGQIVGLGYDAQGGSRGFLMNRGRLEQIDATSVAVFTRPLDINNRGQIVGDYGTKPPATADPSTDASIGFVLDRGRVERIDLPGDGTGAVLGGITNSDRITGKYLDATGYHGLLLDRRRRPTRIDFPGALATYVHKSDERGRTVGAANRTTPDIGTPGTFGYLLEKGRFTRLDIPRAVETQAFGINNHGKVVGEYLDRHGVYHGYAWTNGRFATIDGPLGTGASIVDVNDRGDKVGVYFAEDGTVGGFLLRHGEYTTFAALGLPFTLPFDINNRGQVAGLAFSDPDMTELHGFLLAKGADGPVTQVDVPGAPRTAVYGLDDRGRLVGVYENPDAASPRRSDRERQPSLLGVLPLGLAMGDLTR